MTDSRSKAPPIGQDNHREEPGLDPPLTDVEYELWNDWLIGHGPYVYSLEVPDLPFNLVAEWNERLAGERRKYDDSIVQQVRAAFHEFDQPEGSDHYDGALTESDLHRLPVPEFLIDGYVAAKGVTVVYGQPGVGKTLYLLAAQKAVQRGTHWHGKATKRGGVLFYEGEGHEEFGIRLDAHDLAHAHEGNESPVLYPPDLLDLTKAESVAAVLRTKRRMERDCGSVVRLVVIDPLIEHMTGDENAEGMELATRGLRAIAQIGECAVLVGHHTNASGERARGNDKLRARAHGFFRMERVTEDRVALICEKQRSGEWLAMELTVIPSGPSVAHVRHEEHTAAAYVELRQQRLQKAKKRKRAEGQRQEDAEADAVVLAVISEQPGLTTNRVVAAAEGRGVGKSRIEKARSRLVDDGRVATQSGPNNARLHFAAEEAQR